MMKLLARFRAAWLLLGVVCLGFGSGQRLSAQGASAAGATNATLNPAPWISSALPKPDAEGWMVLFDGKRLAGCTPEAADLESGKVRLDGAVLRVDSTILHFNADCNDLEVRARLKKTSGASLKLTVRNTTGRNLWMGCATFFTGRDRFSVGKNDGRGWKDLGATTTPKRYEEFFDLAVLAQGDQLTLKADGEEIYRTSGSTVDFGGVRFAAQGGATLFERIELRSLDPGPKPQARFVAAVLTNFAAWDKNGDGELQEAEMNRALQEPTLQGEGAAAAAALKRGLIPERSPQAPPLTRPFFQSEHALLARGGSEFRAALRRLRDAAGLPLFATNSPNFAECRQRGLGDCYLVAVLGAALQKEPSALRAMLTPSGSAGAYRVDFPDGTRVEVPALTEAELAWMGAGSAPCLWQRVLEKAWGLRKICRSRGFADPTLEPFDMVSGGSGENMLLSMTGHETADYYLGVQGHEVTPLDTLRTELKGVFQSHRLAEVFTWKAPGAYFLSNHAYALLGYDAEADAVRVWNPIGSDFAPSGTAGPLSGYPTAGGQFTMPVSALPAVFAHVRVETDKPAVVAGPKVFP